MNPKYFISFFLGATLYILFATKVTLINIQTSLSILSLVISIMTAGSILIAYAAYRLSVSDSISRHVIEVISFFRNDVLTANEEFVRLVRREKGEKYKFPSIPFTEQKFQHLIKDFYHLTKEQADLSNISGVSNQKIKILNATTEFAVMVYVYKLENETQLNCLKQAYIELIRAHAETILSHKEFFVGGNSFVEPLNLYFHWKKDIGDESVEERIKKYYQRTYS